jgi:tol-pal system protein YbgF
MRKIGALGLCALALWLGGCVSVAEFRKLEYEVNTLQSQAAERGSGADPTQVADLASEVAALQADLAALEGRVEVAEHRASEALGQARTAREEAGGADGPDGEAEDDAFTGSPEEVEAYRAARSAWRAGQLEACIDRFREFLQTYPTSDYADDAAYWMADCHYKQGDYKTAILRFDDVVGRYPAGDKAPEALFRQGEALLKLGPNYGKAAEKAFERLINEYPDSSRVAEARRQLELLGAG